MVCVIVFLLLSCFFFLAVPAKVIYRPGVAEKVGGMVIFKSYMKRKESRPDPTRLKLCLRRIGLKVQSQSVCINCSSVFTC